MAVAVVVMDWVDQTGVHPMPPLKCLINPPMVMRITMKWDMAVILKVLYLLPRPRLHPTLLPVDGMVLPLLLPTLVFD